MMESVCTVEQQMNTSAPDSPPTRQQFSYHVTQVEALLIEAVTATIK